MINIIINIIHSVATMKQHLTSNRSHRGRYVLTNFSRKKTNNFFWDGNVIYLDWVVSTSVGLKLLIPDFELRPIKSWSTRPEWLNIPAKDYSLCCTNKSKKKDKTKLSPKFLSLWIDPSFLLHGPRQNGPLLIYNT